MTLQKVTRAEFHILETLGFEFATPTPGLKCSDTVCLSGNNSNCYSRRLLAASLAILADCLHHNAEAHDKRFPFIAGPMASQVGGSTWFVSTVLWICLGPFALR